jgi:LmbE family N-acetylglucosaminyl deacetylase
MMPLHLIIPHHDNLKVLCLGAHCDDIEIGCGGTVLRLIESFPNIAFYWTVLSSNEQRRSEAYESARDFLSGVQQREIVVAEFRESYFPWIGAEIKDYFEQLKKRINPDIVFTHYRCDLHQDHRLVSELTWNTFRNHLILEYEIPKYDGDMGSPNLFVSVSEEIAQRKIRTIMQHFESQRARPWFDEDTFRSLMRIRGMECNAQERFAEGFYCRKILL